MKRSVILMILSLILFLLTVLGVYARSKPQQETTLIYITEQKKEAAFDKTVILDVLFDNEIRQMSLDDYLVGVLSAEMPESFPLEALKAQAVAARTFALRQAESKKHHNADVCIHSSCCQGWAESQSSSFKQAVELTDGLVVTYNDQLIDATYFSCSGGRTESAVAVWGSDIPYLQAVQSPEDGASEEITISTEEFAQKIRSHNPQINLEAPSTQWVENITYTKGGGIDTIVIGGVSFTGTSLRSIFSLHSTNISLQINEDQIIIKTCGYGHRVGMSQYGAKRMAEDRCSFAEILTHYYQNTVIQRLYKEKAPLPKTEEA